MAIQRFETDTEVSQVARTHFYIDGRWVAPLSDKATELVSPDTEETMCRVPLASNSDIDRAIGAARDAFDCGPWPKLSGAERTGYLSRLAGELQSRASLMSRLWTAQVGAPVSFAEMFASFASASIGYYGELAKAFEFEDTRPTRLGSARIVRQAVGVAALIAPWNAQTPILSFKLGAALAAGCTVIVKASPETPLDAMVLAECADAAGFPPGVVNVLTADRDEGAYLVSSPKIDKVSFTGSTATGKAIARSCIDRMARFTLELGGKSAAIVLEDAPLEATMQSLVPMTMPFSGQICFAQTRVLVPASREREFIDAYCAMAASLTVGDPWSPATLLGPVSSSRQLDRVLGYIERGHAEGAKLLIGGGRSASFARGYFVDPTVFHVTSEMALAREEVFGPVVSVLTYRDVDDAVRITNDSEYGLSGSIYGGDVSEAFQVARRIRTGQVCVNGFDMTPNVPFGGFKQSGIGREGGPEGLQAFLETQAVYVPEQ
jgi:acyl-CoA reductase-like NAD-dependent aldehyde dehydrogenase